MKIKIIAGVFGHREGKRVIPVRAGDPAIDVDDEIAQRLLSLGVAERVDAEEPKAEAETQGETDGDEGEGVEAFPEYNDGMTRAELNEIAEQVGIDEDAIKEAKTKAELIELLDEAREDYEAGADAPTFDPEADML